MICKKSDDTGGTSVAGNNGNTGSEPVINLNGKKLVGRYHHKSNDALVVYTGAEKEEAKKALAAGVAKSTILTYFIRRLLWRG